MTSEHFTISSLEELAAATHSLMVRGTNRYIFGGANKAGEFLAYTLSFEELDRTVGDLSAHVTETLQVGLVIVEADDDETAFSRAWAVSEFVGSKLIVATLVGDDLTLKGQVYRMEELSLALPELARPTVTPLTLWEESGERRFEPVGPAGPFHTPDEAAGVLHALVEAVEAGDVPDEHLVSQIAVMYQEINTRDRVLGVALGDHPEDGFDPSAKRFIAALRDPDVTFSTQEGWRPILQFIAAHVTDDVAAHAWANAGAYAWLTGRMALAARCAERAQAADPENSFAKLIITATDTGSRPAHILKKMNG